MSTEIAWTDETWNPTTGCDRVSPGCDHCYAMTLAKRLKAMGQEKYQRDGDPRTSGPGFGLTTHADALDLPLHWRKPRRVFVNSMSDLFHPEVPYRFAREVFNTMRLCDGLVRAGDGYRYPSHTFQVLTKRPQRMREFAVSRKLGYDPAAPPRNVWLGTSVENQRYADVRIHHLLDTPAAVRFLSMEPLLGPVDLMGAVEPDWIGSSAGGSGAPHPLIDWVIIGGESGPGARPMEREWAESIVEQCQAAGVAVFVKQLGTVLGGKRHAEIDTFPAGLQVREFPA